MCGVTQTSGRGWRALGERALLPAKQAKCGWPLLTDQALRRIALVVDRAEVCKDCGNRTTAAPWCWAPRVFVCTDPQVSAAPLNSIHNKLRSVTSPPMEGAADAAAAAAAAGGSGAAGAASVAAAAGALEAHPSASSLTLHLPLSPVVAPPVSRGNASDPSAFAAAAAAGTEPTSPRSPQSPRMTRSSSSRQYCAATLRRPGTEVWTWGRGDCGQLATGSLEDSPMPAVVKGLRGRNILNIAAGAFDTAVVTGEGLCCCWWF